jgi:copper chaperone CopZ
VVRAACDDSGCDTAEDGSTGQTRFLERLVARAQRTLSYGLGMLVEEIALWLIVGTLIGGAIAAFVPDEFLTQNLPNPYVQMLAVLAVAVPLYVCATGSVPVAAALVLKGMPLGAAIVFLIAGPATNVATLTVFTKVLGKRIVAIYLGTILILSFAFGILFEELFPHAGVAASLHASHVHEGSLAGMAWWEYLSALLLGLLLLRALRLKAAARWRRRPSESEEGAGASAVGAAREKIQLMIGGMTCTHCRGTVEKALRGVAGVTRVEVSLDEGRAAVWGHGLSAAALAAAVVRSGFTAVPQ